MEWMMMPYKRYADFSGRSRRREYWMFSLFLGIVFTALYIIGGLIGGIDENGPNALFLVPAGLVVLGSIVPSIAVTVRRFHDQDKSGWLYFMSFVPIIGGFLIFIFMLLPGTAGPNRFGADPKGGEAAIFQ